MHMYGRRWSDHKLTPLRPMADAGFISQLLAEREQRSTQHQSEPRANVGAIGAYASGGTIGVRRVPAGYRTTIVV